MPELYETRPLNSQRQLRLQTRRRAHTLEGQMTTKGNQASASVDGHSAGKLKLKMQFLTRTELRSHSWLLCVSYCRWS